MRWMDFKMLISGDANPFVRAHGGWVTRDVWEHPLYQAVNDMAHRIVLRQGSVRQDDAIDLTRDPFADRWIETSEAAASKGISLPALYKAIERGDVIARAHPRRHASAGQRE